MVLAGGGSRGAYEVGVLSYLRDQLARRLGRQVPLDIVCGTSVGAINAAFLAATMDQPATQGRRLGDHWRSLRIEEMVDLRVRDLARAVGLLLGREPAPPRPGSYRYGGLLDTTGLERFVLQHTPWRRIEPNLRAGALRALTVSATHVGTGHTVIFVAGGGGGPLAWSRNPFVSCRRARIGPRHVLASASIPLLFPSVKIGQEYFTDGGLRQNMPMSPALRLGADRVLLISLRHITSGPDPAALQQERIDAYPRPMFLLGKAMNALLLDHTDYDLERMERINEILAAAERAFGPGSIAALSEELTRVRGAPLRTIEAVHIRPSLDIGQLAADFVARGGPIVRGRVTRYLLDRLAAAEAPHETDLLSYLLFDGNYAGELIELGYQDAARQEEALAWLCG